MNVVTLKDEIRDFLELESSDLGISEVKSTSKGITVTTDENKVYLVRVERLDDEDDDDEDDDDEDDDDEDDDDEDEDDDDEKNDMDLDSLDEEDED